VVPSIDLIGDDKDLLALYDAYPVVFDDGTTAVLERSIDLPYAWIAHSSVASSPEDAWSDITNQQLDPTLSVSVEEPVTAANDGSGMTPVEIVSRAQEEIVLTISDNPAAGILVLSEIEYPHWNAYVDGIKVDQIEAFGLLRAVPVPAGSHDIEFRYDDAVERAGMGISLAILLVMVCTFAGLLHRKCRV
jgi:hypothetical protein